MKNLLLTSLILAGLPFTTVDAKTRIAPASADAAAHLPDNDKAKVQIAILLDTSGSMSGLIEQTKTQLWKIVNTFSDAQKDGVVPFVEVALYEYGNDGLGSEEHWIRQIQPLTRDLDQISEDLFALKTNGGSEYCGAVLERAVAGLKWDSSPNVYKAVFIAGNEGFDQGPISPTKACKTAAGLNIYVNTIFCGNENAGASSGWLGGASLAGGRFLTIDHNKAVVHVKTPHDAMILELNKRLNKTYLAFGAAGQVSWQRQSVQDENAHKKAKSGAHVQRALSKSSGNYYNSSWDLVDAAKQKHFKIESVKNEALPKEMQEMNLEQKKQHIAKMEAERKAIQLEIKALNKKRLAWIAAQQKADAKTNTLDSAIIRTVREQAEKKGYLFE